MAPPCKFWAQGNCRNGERCTFSHGEAPSAPPGSSSVPCRFFLAGNCAYGSSCRYVHASSSGGDSRPKPKAAFFTGPGPRSEQAAASSTGTGHQEERIQLPEDLSWGLGDAEDDAWDEEDDPWRPQADPSSSQGNGSSTAATTTNAWQTGRAAAAAAAGSQAASAWQDGSTASAGGTGNPVEDIHCTDRPAEDMDWDVPPAAISDGPTDPADLPLCSSFAASGSCPRGDDCHLIHGDLCSVCGHHALHPYNPEEAEQHRQECQRRHDRLAARLRSAEVECGICMERVLSKPNPSERRFGLMSCDHPFCLACIRGWRATGTADLETAVRTCPLCRTTTHFVVPSTVWPVTPEEKEGILSGYKTKLGEIHCRHFARGAGTCPFGTSCFYRHVRADGTEEPKDPSKLRRYVGQEGEVRIVSGVRLSDFLDTPAARATLNSGRRRVRTARNNHEYVNEREEESNMRALTGFD